MTQDASPPSPKLPQTEASGPCDHWTAAWPTEPQQLFLLLLGDSAQAANWRELAHNLAQHFPQGAVAVLPLPAEITQVEHHSPAAVAALRQLVQQWQTRAGLDFARTAIIAQGVAASIAVQAVMQHADLCARLFAVGGQLPEQATPIAEHTCLHWLHARDTASPSAELAREWGQRLQALDVDFTLDVLEGRGPAANCAPELQQRILHLLQNHVPRRLWREALASAGSLDIVMQSKDDGPSVLH